MNYMTNSKQKFVAFRRKLDLWERRENDLFPYGSLGCSDTSGRHCINYRYLAIIKDLLDIKVWALSCVIDVETVGNMNAPMLRPSRSILESNIRDLNQIQKFLPEPFHYNYKQPCSGKC
jgi:hypothetical protein